MNQSIISSDRLRKRLDHHEDDFLFRQVKRANGLFCIENSPHIGELPFDWKILLSLLLPPPLCHIFLSLSPPTSPGGPVPPHPLLSINLIITKGSSPAAINGDHQQCLSYILVNKEISPHLQ
jgi:hypothetical protein